MKQTFVLLLSLFVYSTTAFSASLIDQKYAGLSGQISCDKLIDLWQLEDDQVNGDTIRLTFQDGVSFAECTSDTFVAKKLSFLDFQGRALNVPSFIEDFDLRKFQLKRKYGDYAENEETGEVRVSGEKVQVYFKIRDSKVTRVTVDYAYAALYAKRKPIAISMLYNLLDHDFYHPEFERSVYTYPDTCKMEIRSEQVAPGDFTGRRVIIADIDFTKRINSNRHSGQINYVESEGVKISLLGGGTYSHLPLFFRSGKQAEYERLVSEFEALCKKW